MSASTAGSKLAEVKMLPPFLLRNAQRERLEQLYMVLTELAR